MIDIALAVYNGEKYLKDQLNSIFSQTYNDFKVIIGDNGSNDNSVKIIDEFIKKYPEKIEYFLNDKGKKSPKNNFFDIIKKCKASYVMFCDQDDVWDSEKIERSIKFIKEKEEKNKNTPILVHTDLKVVNENLNIISDSMFISQKLDKNAKTLNKLLIQNNITGCTMIVNRALLNYVCDIPDKAIMHDWYLGLMAASFGKIYFLDYKTVLYRQHNENNVGAKDIGKLSFIMKKAMNIKNIKKSLNDTYDQAEAFLDEFYDKLKTEDRQLIKNYISLKNSNKIKKIKIIIKNKFYKNSFLRVLGQFIYI